MYTKYTLTVISAFLLVCGMIPLAGATADVAGDDATVSREKVAQIEETQAVKPTGEMEAKATLAARAAEVLDEVMKAPDQGIPVDLLNRAECVAVFPSTLKVSFLVGAKYGYGLVSCRQQGSDRWGAPTFFTLAGGSIGLQAGAKATDLILVVMNENGVNSVLQSRVTLGADIGVTAGPVGRDASASTDALLGAGILSYSRSEGIFAGVELDGSVLIYDAEATKQMYGEEWDVKTVLLGGKNVAPSMEVFTQALSKYAPRRVARLQSEGTPN